MTIQAMKISPLLRQSARHSFKSLKNRRSLSCQGHTFNRFASTTASAAHITSRAGTREAAKADWAKQFKRAGGNAVFYFPFFIGILGWPLMAEKAVEWSQGVK